MISSSALSVVIAHEAGVPVVRVAEHGTAGFASKGFVSEAPLIAKTLHASLPVPEKAHVTVVAAAVPSRA